MKVQAHSSSEPPLECNQDQTNLRVTEILFSFRLVLEGKAHMKIAESSRLEFLEKCLTNSLLHQMQKTIPTGC